MHTFISMLRGINVSGQKKIRMAELSNLYESLGLVQVKTYVQSGNVVFASPEPDGSKLAQLIEAEIEQTFGFAVSVFMRDNHDFQRIIDRNPFLGDRHEDPAKRHVTFLYRRPDESEWRNLSIPDDEADEFSVGEQEIFLFCPNGYGRTKFSNNFFERKLKVPATTRNWKTVTALAKLATETET
jgi:uncharacterized protein (DUF1697 family)